LKFRDTRGCKNNRNAISHIFHDYFKRLIGPSTDYGLGITTVISNYILVTGWISGNVDLNGDGDSTDETEDVTYSVVYGNWDVFISKFSD
jgi:hypothetical protein